MNIIARIFALILHKITNKEHKFTVKWHLVDKKTNKRLEKDFAIGTVGLYFKEDIQNKRLINKTLNPQSFIKSRVLKNSDFINCELSYSIVCYYGYLKR